MLAKVVKPELLELKFTVLASTPIPTLNNCAAEEDELVKPAEANPIPPPSAELNVRSLLAPDWIVRELTAKKYPFTVMVVLLL